MTQIVAQKKGIDTPETVAINGLPSDADTFDKAARFCEWLNSLATGTNYRAMPDNYKPHEGGASKQQG